MTYYLLVVWNDVSISKMGPFKTAKLRDACAKEHRKSRGYNDGLYKLQVDNKGRPSVCDFAGGFFDD